MAYNAKTNWQDNEIVKHTDLNRIEQGIKGIDDSIAAVNYYATGTNDNAAISALIQKLMGSSSRDIRINIHGTLGITLIQDTPRYYCFRMQNSNRGTAYLDFTNATVPDIEAPGLFTMFYATSFGGAYGVTGLKCRVNFQFYTSPTQSIMGQMGTVTCFEGCDMTILTPVRDPENFLPSQISELGIFNGGFYIHNCRFSFIGDSAGRELFRGTSSGGKKSVMRDVDISVDYGTIWTADSFSPIAYVGLCDNVDIVLNAVQSKPENPAMDATRILGFSGCGTLINCTVDMTIQDMESIFVVNFNGVHAATCCINCTSTVKVTGSISNSFSNNQVCGFSTCRRLIDCEGYGYIPESRLASPLTTNGMGVGFFMSSTATQAYTMVGCRALKKDIPGLKQVIGIQMYGTSSGAMYSLVGNTVTADSSPWTAIRKHSMTGDNYTELGTIKI